MNIERIPNKDIEFSFDVPIEWKRFGFAEIAMVKDAVPSHDYIYCHNRQDFLEVLSYWNQKYATLKFVEVVE